VAWGAVEDESATVRDGMGRKRRRRVCIMVLYLVIKKGCTFDFLCTENCTGFCNSKKLYVGFGL
jgi:hypothetical protein